MLFDKDFDCFSIAFYDLSDFQSMEKQAIYFQGIYCITCLTILLMLGKSPDEEDLPQ